MNKELTTMNSIREMSKKIGWFLNRMLGALVGIIFYPLKSILINVLIYIILLVTCVIYLIFKPFIYAKQKYQPLDETFNLIERIFYPLLKAVFNYFFMAIYWASLTYFVVFAFPYIVIVFAAYDCILKLWMGAVLGGTEGVSAIVKKLCFQWTELRPFLRLIMHLNHPTRMRANPIAVNDLDYLQEDFFNLVDVERSPPGPFSDDLEQSVAPELAIEFIPLSEDELMAAANIKELETTLKQYSDLSARLRLLDSALSVEKDKDEPLPNIYDELITSMEVTKPILVLKQCEVNLGQWRVVPATTKISDEISFKTWLTGFNNRHPTDGVPIDKAASYQDKPCRYRFHQYKGHSQEQQEAAETIRQSLRNPHPPLASAAAISGQ